MIYNGSVIVGLAAASIVVAGFLAGLGLACVLLSRALARKEQEIRGELSEIFHQLVDPPDKDTPSALGVLGDHVATMFAARLVQQVEVRLRGSHGGSIAREHDAQVAETSGSLMQIHPILGLFAGLLPKKMSRELLRDPTMLASLAKLGSRGSSGNGSGSGSQQGQFQLPT